jgi:DNA polymerase III subunit alpha
VSKFIHLHNHSHYSLLDAICTIDGLIESAKKFNMPALALTDHGVMYGAMEFYKKAKANDIKPIIGCEMYIITEGSRFDKGKNTTIFETGFVTNGNSASLKSKGKTEPSKSGNKGGYKHIVLLAKNYDGYKNLLKLASLAQTEGFYYKPRIDLELLKQYSSDLVALSACAGGIVSAHLVQGEYEIAKDTAKIYHEIFGDDFYLEIQNHGMDVERPVLQYMPQIAEELGIKLVATNDIHYIEKGHHIPHNLYLYINTDLSKDKEGKNLEVDLRYGTDQVYFKSAEEMCELFKDYPQAIESTLEITDKCNLELPKNVYYMPDFPIPENAGVKTLDEYLEKASFEGLYKKLPDAGEIETTRLNHELKVIKEMNFSGYFLIVADFIKHAKDNGVLVGPGRGSAVGSLVCYALDINTVNPLDYDLLFERFLNSERVSMPDIDIDFQDDKRDDVIQYSKDKYGETSVSQIVTFNKLKTKAVLKDVGRVLNYPFDTINEVTKQVPSLFGKIKSLQDCYNDIPDFKSYFDAEPERKKLLKYSIVLENLNKNSSVHASGVVIAPSDITNYVPVCRTPQVENQFMTQYDMKMLEDAGLIKMDFLGLKELKILSQTIDLIYTRHNVKIDLDKLDLTDVKTYELFSNGNTIGVFQFSRPKMREYLSKLKPKNINDLAAMNALYRPGPMDLIPEFIEKKHNTAKEVKYIHPIMEPILKDTYGIIVFQEQVMQLVRDIAGYSLAKADIVRRAMGKKDEKLMKQQEKEFIVEAGKKGVERKVAKEIFNLILKFADYGFNKSHSVAYSVLAYYTAYLKCHYPLEFMTTQLNCRKDDKDEMVSLINECRRMKLKLSTPNINKCFSNFTIDESEENTIRFGLSSVKNVGGVGVENIIKERGENGDYTNFIDFCSRVDTRTVNKKTIESLIFAGAFDVIESNRKKLHVNYEKILDKINNSKSPSASQHSLFGIELTKEMISSSIISSLVQDCEDWTFREKLSLEKSVIGVYISSHPLLDYADEIESVSTLKFGDAEDVSEDSIDISKIESVRMSGVVSGLKVKTSKRGNTYCIFILEDMTGQGECIMWPNVYEEYKSKIQNDDIIVAVGRPEENGNVIKLIVETIRPLTKTTKENIKVNKKIEIKIDSRDFQIDKFSKLKELLIFNKNDGDLYDIFITVKKNDNQTQNFVIENVQIKQQNNINENLTSLFGVSNIIF